MQLSAAIGHPVGASALQLTIGAALLVALAAALGSLGKLGALDDVAGWHLVGGLGSAVYITAGILLFPRLGAVLTVGLFIAGQMLVSLTLDATGALGVETEPIRVAAGDGCRARRVAPTRGAGRRPESRPVVGLARRLVRRDLRDVGVPADPGDRGRADHRPDDRGSATRVGARRPPRAAAAATPADHASPQRGRDPSARRRR